MNNQNTVQFLFSFSILSASFAWPSLFVVIALLSETPRGMFIIVQLGQVILTQQRLERIATLQQIHHLAILRRQTPLARLKHALTRRSPARKPHHSRPLRSLDREVNVDNTVQLVHLAANPGNLVLEVDFVSEDLARPRRRAQRIHGAGDDGRRGLLVVEDGHGAGCHAEQEKGEGLAPAESNIGDFCNSLLLAGC